MDKDTFVPGYIQDGVFVKKISQGNILRLPVPSFTIDQAKYDGLRPYFKRVRIIVKETSEIYEISADDFDRLRILYDYGNGPGYRVEVKAWEKVAAQIPLL